MNTKENNKPVFKSDNPKAVLGSTYLAYCPKCDKVIEEFRQEKCSKCGLKLDWS